jgi:hypothetical protein
MNKNSFTPVKHLLKKKTRHFGRVAGKETEPRIFSREVSENEEKQELASVPESSPERAKEIIEEIPELPELDDELKNEGVELVDHNTIFINNRKLNLPLPLEDVDQGFHKPLTSGWRWLSELSKYILRRFHIVIKKIGGKIKLVEKN